MKILIINDYAPGRYATGRILRENGYEISEAGDGASGLQMAGSESPDLILLDVNLPDIDGFEVCRRLKSNPATASIAVLQTSASFIGGSDRVRGLDEGADAYLVEPVEPTELVATIRALLRMRTAERGLRAAANAWSATFDAIGDPIAVVDEQGIVLRANLAFREQFSLESEPSGRSVTELVVRNDSTEDRALLTPLLSSAERRTVELPVGGKLFRITLNPQRSDGHDGQSRSGVLVFVDITHERRIEQERALFLQAEKEALSLAERSVQRSEFLSRASAVLTASLAVDDIAVSLSRLCTREFADWCFIDLIDPNEEVHLAAMSARNPAGSLPARDAHLLALNARDKEHPIHRVLAGGAMEAVSPSLRLAETAEPLPADQTKIGVRSMICAPLSARGRVLGALTTSRAETSGDFTADEVEMLRELSHRLALAIDNARLYRDAQAANQAKDEFLATLSHELRTPLTATLGWTRMLRMGGLDDETFAAALETIERSTRVQSQIIEDILDVSRIVTGKLAVKMESVDCAPLIYSAVEAVRPAAEEKAITVQCEIEDAAPPLWGDPRRLQQIVWNLLSNALKFTPSGGTVTVRYAARGSTAVLEIADSGQGIAPAFLPFVFDRFRQADGASTREHGGLGLGLAIVKHLVQMHHGEIRAHSDGPERGARFIVEFPLRRPAARVQRSPEPASMLPSLSGLSVLVVEEDGNTREWIKAVLQKHGAEIVAVPSARAALEKIVSTRPDVVVSDLALPEEERFEFVRLLRSGGGKEELPIVALSAHARAEDRDRAMAAGFSSYLQTPLDPADLAGEVARLARQEVEDVTERGK